MRRIRPLSRWRNFSLKRKLVFPNTSSCLKQEKPHMRKQSHSAHQAEAGLKASILFSCRNFRVLSSASHKPHEDAPTFPFFPRAEAVLFPFPIPTLYLKNVRKIRRAKPSLVFRLLLSNYAGETLPRTKLFLHRRTSSYFVIYVHDLK